MQYLCDTILSKIDAMNVTWEFPAWSQKPYFTNDILFHDTAYVLDCIYETTSQNIAYETKLSLTDNVAGGVIDLARETLILQPPEKCLVGRSCISLVKPRPARIRRAFGSAESTPAAFISS